MSRKKDKVQLNGMDHHTLKRWQDSIEDELYRYHVPEDADDWDGRTYEHFFEEREDAETSVNDVLCDICDSDNTFFTCVAQWDGETLETFEQFRERGGTLCYFWKQFLKKHDVDVL